ncbi:MAG TPA: cold shock domain-containing protein [Candidatus Paceibacterota bacterium]|jgi:CspA family cold shock protein|nr:cold shock domain-containing protein [Candidatus Paceibacterota bacterium]
MKGTIKKLVSDRSFGFINVEGESKDIFFHKDKLVGVSFGDLHEGDTVSFETEQTEKNGETKTNAVNVQRA